jgi:hypothetical protein
VITSSERILPSIPHSITNSNKRIFPMAKAKKVKQEIKVTKAKISKQEGKLKKLKKELKKAKKK